jgi:hypothetical protein
VLYPNLNENYCNDYAQKHIPTVQVAYAAASVPNVATKNGPLCGQQLPVGELQLIR